MPGTENTLICLANVVEMDNHGPSCQWGSWGYGSAMFLGGLIKANLFGLEELIPLTSEEVKVPLTVIEIFIEA